LGALHQQVKGANDLPGRTVAENNRNTESAADEKARGSAAAALPGGTAAGTEQTPGGVPGAAPDFRTKTAESPASGPARENPHWSKAIAEFQARLQPNQGGVIWLAIFVTLVVAFNFQNWLSWRNADLLLLLAPSFLMVDLVRFAVGLQDPYKLSLSGFAFLGIFFLSVLLLIRALIGAFTRAAQHWTPNVPSSILVGLIALLLACSAYLVLVRAPDDCGYYSNLGAARMLETGKFPYADPLLRNGAGATYGPVLYVAHIPFQLGLSLIGSNREANDHSQKQETLLKVGREFVEPPILATKLAFLSFHLLAVLALVMIGRNLMGLPGGLGLACLYIGSPYVLGIGGETALITGTTYISHTAPTAVSLFAFAMLGRPWVSGALLAVGTGILFYPAFLFPLWLGYYFWRGRDWVKFAAGFLIVSAVIWTTTLLMTQTSPDETALAALYESTVGHQEAKHAYGSSSFSFWGTHPRIAGVWQKPFIEGSYLFRPSVVVFGFFIAASFFMARGRAALQLALLTSAVVIAIQLWKSHAGGTYVEWYYPFFLIGVLAHPRRATSQPPERHAAVEA
jgi:hypothetical protein